LIPTFVADASVAMAWVLQSQSSPEAIRLLDETGSGCFAVPAVWPFEVANTLAMMLRRRKVSRDEYLSARLFLDGLRISVDDEGTKFAGTHTADLALEHNLTVYDAAYLELAIRKQIPLASRDTDLNRAAKRCSVPVLL
jgi:predicted nucleic acid-binding protein